MLGRHPSTANSLAVAGTTGVALVAVVRSGPRDTSVPAGKSGSGLEVVSVAEK
jgi:hypothetical protein